MQNYEETSGLIPKQTAVCPTCGEKTSIIPILYGLPNLDAIQLEAQGKLVLGSRFFRPGLPCWRCKKCKLDFGETQENDA